MQRNSNTKPNINIEGKMSSKDAGKVAIIMAWGKTISMVIGSCSGALMAFIFLMKYTP